MKISYDEINNRNDPYQLFLDGIKSPETARKYKKLLERFLRSIPNEVYEKSPKRKIKNSDKEAIARTFVDLAKKNPNLAMDIIATYIKEEKRIIWKKIQEAKKKGELLDISEFGKSQGLSWKNLYSEK